MNSAYYVARPHLGHLHQVLRFLAKNVTHFLLSLQGQRKYFCKRLLFWHLKRLTAASSFVTEPRIFIKASARKDHLEHRDEVARGFFENPFMLLSLFFEGFLLWFMCHLSNVPHFFKSGILYNTGNGRYDSGGLQGFLDKVFRRHFVLSSLLMFLEVANTNPFADNNILEFLNFSFVISGLVICN